MTEEGEPEGGGGGKGQISAAVGGLGLTPLLPPPQVRENHFRGWRHRHHEYPLVLQDALRTGQGRDPGHHPKHEPQPTEPGGCGPAKGAGLPGGRCPWPSNIPLAQSPSAPPLRRKTPLAQRLGSSHCGCHFKKRLSWLSPATGRLAPRHPRAPHLGCQGVAPEATLPMLFMGG